MKHVESPHNALRTSFWYVMCGICHGDNRQCSCSDQPSQKKKKKTSKGTSLVSPVMQSSSNSHDQTPSYTELQKLYQSLQQDQERVGQEFQNEQEVNEEMARDSEEKERDADELAAVVCTKCEVIKTLEKRLVQEKKMIAELGPVSRKSR